MKILHEHAITLMGNLILGSFSRGRSEAALSDMTGWYGSNLMFQGHFSGSNPAVKGVGVGGEVLYLGHLVESSTPLHCSCNSDPGSASQLRHSPNLFCIVHLDLRPLLDEFGVLLHIFDPPLRVLLQVIKLILEKEKRRGSIDSISQIRGGWQ